ncbi:MAG: LacI family DNA-binding transcriptional regulator [Pseudomonadota bacterium]
MTNKVGKIRDVARETGLSIATISRVMNGATNVSDKTREIVLKASRELHYVPNPAARTLSTRKSKTIAAIIPTIENSVFAKYVSAIEQTLSDEGYALVFAISNADPEQESQAVGKLLGLGAEAFILSGADHSEEMIELFESRNVPYVFTSIWQPGAEIPTIGYDNFALASQALSFLETNGHTNIAIVHGPIADSDRTASRCDGARAACSQGTRLAFFETEISVSGGKQAVENILSQPAHPSAILCFSDVLALGTYFALSERGIRIPLDMSVMGFDNLDWSAHIDPPLTTINLPARKMGREVARQLVDHLENAEPIRSAQLNGELIDRASVLNIGEVSMKD